MAGELIDDVNQCVEAAVGVNLRLGELPEAPRGLFGKPAEFFVRSLHVIGQRFDMIGQREVNVNKPAEHIVRPLLGGLQAHLAFLELLDIHRKFRQMLDDEIDSLLDVLVGHRRIVARQDAKGLEGVAAQLN